MSKEKFFEADDQIISFHVIGIEKDLLIFIDEPFKRKKPLSLIYSKEDAIEIANELLRVISEMNNL